MNYIRHLNAFFTVIRNDKRLTSAHVSLYMAMFQYWNFNRFQNPFTIHRDVMLSLSKIGSKNTYHKCLKELHLAGYIVQHISLLRYAPIKISMVRFASKEEDNAFVQLDLFSTNNDTKVPPLVSINTVTLSVPILTNDSPNYNTQPDSNMGHLLKHNQTNENKSENESQKNVSNDNDVLRTETNSTPPVSNSVLTPVVVKTQSDLSITIPSFNEVVLFFKTKEIVSDEASKFFHHYNSNGWLIGGKSPMKNWQSSAIKWMLNIPVNTKNMNPHALSNAADKDYSEPL